ncbi:fibrous sheath CABYR-binding protein-like [Penaeus japonicus]|uniref:fibrous sheath CABYR-binding protein-like n=1 Tax=Penaeus japonicus TaxID=27405 RepID=UPI001C7115E5|nr:fibrous sheath CABYR-binding protein-like [Penaeus japonicus]
MKPTLSSVAAAVAVMLAVVAEGRPRTIVDYNAGSHSRRESGLPGIAVEGEYRWRTPNGQENVVRYTADKNGYVARGNVVPGYYEPLGTPGLVHSYDQSPPEGLFEAAEADSSGVLMAPAEEEVRDSPAEEGSVNALGGEVDVIPVEKAAGDVPAEEAAEDTLDGDVAEDVSDKEIADDTPTEEVAEDAPEKAAAEDLPAKEADEGTITKDAEENIAIETVGAMDDAQAEAAEVEGDSPRAEKAVPAEKMAGMNAIIFPEDPSPSVPLVKAGEEMPEAQASGMNAIIFPEDDMEVMESELPAEDTFDVEMEDLPEMNIISATEMPLEEESIVPEIVMPEDSATDESVEGEELVTTEAPEEVAPVTASAEEDAEEEEVSTETPTEATGNGDDGVTDVPSGDATTDAPAEETQATEAPSDVAVPEEASVTDAPVEKSPEEELTTTESPVVEEASSASETALEEGDYEEEVTATDSPVEEAVATEAPVTIPVEEEVAAATSVPEVSSENPIMEEFAANEAPVMSTETLLMAGGSVGSDALVKEDEAPSMPDDAASMDIAVESDDAPLMVGDGAVDVALSAVPDMPGDLPLPVDTMDEDMSPALPTRSAGEEEHEEPELLGYIHSHPHAHFFDEDHHAYPAHPHSQSYRPHFKVYSGAPDGGHKVHHGHVFNFYH